MNCFLQLYQLAKDCVTVVDLTWLLEVTERGSVTWHSYGGGQPDGVFSVDVNTDCSSSQSRPRRNTHAHQKASQHRAL